MLHPLAPTSAAGRGPGGCSPGEAVVRGPGLYDAKRTGGPGLYDAVRTGLRSYGLVVPADVAALLVGRQVPVAAHQLVEQLRGGQHLPAETRLLLAETGLLPAETGLLLSY